ncbi:Chemotaxis response regulator protein-glutamate methylesterase CheB [Minicystis rosea]|nr:Chemotaxis response regulator protein-glutamate methylesterase CheB [Minicystis rosea]
MKRLRVVIVNDSATMRAALAASLRGFPDIEVIAEIGDGNAAVTVVRDTRPSVVLMDVIMPGCDGYAATRKIMATTPTPIVMISSVVDPRDTNVILSALGAGALSIAEAPPPPTDPSYRLRCAALAQLLRSMADVRVARSDGRPATRLTPVGIPAVRPSPVGAIGIVASTGGPSAMCDVLSALPLRTMPPILVVQHLAKGFAPSFAQWLGERTSHDVRVAVHGAPIDRGTVWIAPDEQHLGVTPDLRIALSDTPPVGVFRPSATYLLTSLSRSFGTRALGVVLTGMADDGADGAVALRNCGGRMVAQDEATSVIYGMPRAAFERGGVDDVLPLGDIGAWLCQKCGIAC